MDDDSVGLPWKEPRFYQVLPETFLLLASFVVHPVSPSSQSSNISVIRAS